MTSVKAKYISSLRRIFVESRDKHEANRRSAEVLSVMSADNAFFTEVLRVHLQKPGTLNILHYPVVGLDIEQNEHFTLVANCWIPLPDNSIDVSTKAIHHHGDMLLSTATAFGTGYEHWLFETPSLVDATAELYDLKLIERASHPLNHVAFVDAYVAHLPMYPPDLTITYALWSSRFPTTWKDKVKRIPLFSKNSSRLRELGKSLGLAKSLELKSVEYFDFFPCTDGFKGIKDREEFPLTNNEDYLASLFHIIQETGNDSVIDLVEQKLNGNEEISDRNTVRKFIGDVRSGKPVRGRLSPEHYNVAGANFSSAEIIRSLESSGSTIRNSH